MREGHVQSLAYLILQGWIQPDENEVSLVSDDELRDILLYGGDDFRSQILWQLQHSLDNATVEDFEGLILKSESLFRDVWPRQRSVKNPTMSRQLFEWLVSNDKIFPKLTEAVLPLLTAISQANWLHFPPEVDEIIKKHPRLFLRMLGAILPDEIAGWPYDMGDIFEKINHADRDLLSDALFQELMRKWTSR
jgi:hypothetical protein